MTTNSTFHNFMVHPVTGATIKALHDISYLGMLFFILYHHVL